MKIQAIESAVRKQLPFRKETHFFMRTDVTKDALMDAGLVLICGLANIYATPKESVQEKAIELYDINARQFKKFSDLYFKHIDRAATIIQSYGVNVQLPHFYRLFSNKFWDTHNQDATTEPYKTGIMLSHILSSRREYNVFLANHTSHFVEEDFTSFFIFNKAQLTKNYIALKLGNVAREKYVDLRDMGY